MSTVVTAAAPVRERRPSWSGGALAGLLVTLEQPSGWAIALAGFLARGGLLAFLLPIVILPTPAGIQARLSPLLRPVVLGDAPVGLVAVVAISVLSVAAVVLAGALLGGWVDVVLIRRVRAAIADLPEDAGTSWSLIVRVAAARLIALGPLTIALGWGSVRLVEVTYRELLTPFEVSSPLALRIAAGAPDALAVVIVAWLLGEAAGGLAAREVVLGGRGVGRAVAAGWSGLVRWPAGSLATLLATTVLVWVAIIPGLVAAAAAWHRLRGSLHDGRPIEVVVSLGLFVGLWLGGLILAGVATSARSGAWSAEWLRRAPLGRDDPDGDVPAVGTIGQASTADRGGWPRPKGSGTL